MNKQLIIIFIFISIAISSTAKDSTIFYISIYKNVLRNNKIRGHFTVSINNKLIQPTLKKQKIKTNYPEFDTVYYYSDSNHIHHFITRFTPNEKYCFVSACCTDFDIIKKKRVKSYMSIAKNNPDNAEIVKNEFLDSVSVSFVISSEKSNDSIFALFSDYATFPLSILLDTSTSEYYRAPKGFYWNNASRIIIGKPKQPYPKSSFINREATDYVYMEDNFDVYCTLNYRFFNGTKLLIRYDEASKKMEVIIEE